MPLSKRPSARRKQLSNLRVNNPAGVANMRARTHGARAKPPSLRLESIEAELLAALPVRTPAGEAPIHDRPMVSVAATVIARLQRVTAWLDEHGGELTRGGRVRAAAQYEMELSTRAANLLDRLGCSPMSRAKLGLTLAQTRDLAQEMSALSNTEPPDAEVVDDDEPVYDPVAEEWDK